MSGRGNGGTTPALERTLRRIEELTSALYQAPNAAGREAARELLEVVLDLHGLGLARISAIVAAAENGSSLTRLLAADPYARAVMLLHGLHPLSIEERLNEAIAGKRAQWSERGVEVQLLRAGQTGAQVRVHANGSGSAAECAREVESVLIDAAPDLDDLVVEFDAAPADRIGQDDGRRIEA